MNCLVIFILVHYLSGKRLMFNKIKFELKFLIRIVGALAIAAWSEPQGITIILTMLIY